METGIGALLLSWDRPKALRRYQVMTQVEQRLEGAPEPGRAAPESSPCAHHDLTVRANELQHEITVMVRRLAPSLLSLPGRGVLTPPGSRRVDDHPAAGVGTIGRE
jgi:hypothetical protein